MKTATDYKARILELYAAGINILPTIQCALEDAAKAQRETCAACVDEDFGTRRQLADRVRNCPLVTEVER